MVFPSWPGSSTHVPFLSAREQELECLLQLLQLGQSVIDTKRTTRYLCVCLFLSMYICMYVCMCECACFVSV